MRKLFSILSAVLVSLAMQATVVRQGINLSSMSKYGTVYWTLATKTIETDNENSWAGIHTGATLDATGYKELVLVLSAGFETVNVNLGVDYTGGTPASHNVTNTAGKNIIRLPLQGTNISDIIIRVTNTNSSAVIDTLYLYGVVGKKEPIQLFDGSVTPHVAPNNWNDAWNGRLLLDQPGDIAKFAKAHEGDTIAFTYTSTENQCYISCGGQCFEDYPGDYGNGQIEINASQSEPAVKKFALRGEDIENLQTSGMFFTGINYTITDVTLITYEQQFMEEIILETGEESLGTEVWDQHWEQTSGLPTLTAGDELRVTVSAVDNSGNYQMYFKYGWGEGQQIAVTGIDANIPKFYSVTLTAEQASAINTAGQLFLYGTGVTLSRFAIAKPRGIYSTLYHGEKAMEWTGLFYEASQFSGLTVGDRICANVSEIGDRGDYPKLIFSANYTEFTPSAQYDFSANNAAPMTVSYPVTAEMLSLIQANGLRLRGEYCTLTEVYVQSAEPTKVSYKLPVSAAGMATLVLPFNVPSLPEGVEAYTLVNNGDATIWANQVSSIEADKPVLIVAAQNEDPGYEFVSENGGNKDISGKAGTYRNEALVGTYKLINPLYGTDGEGGHYHYILNNGANGVAFYQVKDESCYVEPYKAYLSCGYPGNNVSSAPMRVVFHKDAPTSTESIQSSAIRTQKILRNGQILILRDNKKFNVLGQQL